MNKLKQTKEKEQIFSLFVTEINEILLDKDLEFDGNSLLINDLELDSLDVAQLMLVGEKFVESKVDEEKIDWSKVQTLNELVSVIYQCQF